MGRDGAERLWSGRLFQRVGGWEHWAKNGMSPKVQTLVRGVTELKQGAGVEDHVKELGH